MGETLPVLFEEEKEGFGGATPQLYRSVRPGTALHNVEQRVRITGVRGTALVGERVEERENHEGEQIRRPGLFEKYSRTSRSTPGLERAGEWEVLGRWTACLDEAAPAYDAAALRSGSRNRKKKQPRRAAKNTPADGASAGVGLPAVSKIQNYMRAAPQSGLSWVGVKPGTMAFARFFHHAIHRTSRSGKR